MTATTTNAVVKQLTLDHEGELAFVRLSNTLPRIADTLKALGEDMVVVPPETIEAGVDTVISDLELISTQIHDAALRARIKAAHATLAELAVPQTSKADLSTDTLTNEGGAKQPDQGDLEETPQAKITFTILSKADPATTTTSDQEERTVLGIVLEPEVVDSQNDIYSAEEIRKTAYRFMERYQQFGLMHKQIVQSILPLESYIAPVDFEINGQKVKKGTWLLRVRVLDDQIWSKVKSGELTGFSIGGSAVRTPDTVAA